MVNVKSMLAMAIERGASDVHVNTGMSPIMRIHTELVEMDLPAVSESEVESMILDMTSAEKYQKFGDAKDLDFSTTSGDGNRFRVNAHFQRDTIAISFRVIPNDIPILADLNLPEVIADLTELPRGLVLVTGHTGSGKSTTLASMICRINSMSSKRIITLEDPIEYAQTNDKTMIEQREIGADCTNFASGLRHALRQDPDIIMVGEMRDLDTTSSTITAAETGHLVFSTLHTVNAAQTVERIIDIYPAAQQNQIRAMLSNTLQAVISQTLFKRMDKPGMVPCTEILLCTSAVRNCIREGRVFEIPNIIETSRRLRMQTMDYSISQMYEYGYISREEAVLRATNPAKMDKHLTPSDNNRVVAEQLVS